MDFIPEKSEIQISNIKMNDHIVKEMVRELGIKQLVNQHRTDRRTRNWVFSNQPKWNLFNLLHIKQSLFNI